MKKKLLFVISQLYKGGAETSLVNLLNKLDYSKYSVELLILNQSPVDNAVSLIERVNREVCVCNAYEEYKNISILDRAKAKFLYSAEQKGAYYITALNFVKNKYYDWAFFVGEWYSPSFVAYEVEAKIKAAWIHNDLSDAEYFDGEHYFYFADMFDYFVFVSQHSLEASVKTYPFLKNKARVIYNINDAEYIRSRAKEPVNMVIETPSVLTCANFRLQKNHLRQVQVMSRLREKGIEFTWINIGATTDNVLVEKVRALSDANGLKDKFLILGPQENPYKYIKNVDAVTVLSDYESWSMVITEAKLLGTPVIATKTSGAVEQICDGENGVLTEFDVDSIVNKMEEFFKNEDLAKKIRSNLHDFDNTEEILESFDKLIDEGRPSKGKADVLYVIDDINYMGGAHIATKLQIQSFIEQNKKILVYASNVPNIKIRTELNQVNFLTFRDFREDTIFRKRLFYCLTDERIDKEEKRRKIRNTINGYRKKLNYETDILPYISNLFSKYPTVCVMSEGSAYRDAVGKSKCRNKIQWIHIDYCDWKNKTDWTRNLTKNDGEIYRNFDKIVVLTDSIKQSFINLYPHLQNKVYVNRNLMPVSLIRKKAENPSYKNDRLINFVTVGRVDYQKAYPRLIKVLAELKQEGYQFKWTIIGDGNEFLQVNNMIRDFGMEKEIIMKGAMHNPYPEIKKADIFALLSDFEGLPNTIYEALILGVPVLATNVGGVSSQIETNKNGWLVENNAKDIRKNISYLLENPNDIFRVKKNLEMYIYDNVEIVNKNNMIFDIDS